MENMRVLIIALLLSFNVFSQSGKLTIIVNGETVEYYLKDCYQRTRTVKTKQGVNFKVVVWRGYARWSKRKHLVIRSIGGKYSTERALANIIDNVEINFDE